MQMDQLQMDTGTTHIKQENKSVFSLVDSAVNTALPAFAAKPCRAAPLLLGAGACYRSISPLRVSSSNKLNKFTERHYCGRSTGQTDRQMDRGTDTRPLHKLCPAYHAGSTNNIPRVIRILILFVITNC